MGLKLVSSCLFLRNKQDKKTTSCACTHALKHKVSSKTPGIKGVHSRQDFLNKQNTKLFMQRSVKHKKKVPNAQQGKTVYIQKSKSRPEIMKFQDHSPRRTHQPQRETRCPTVSGLVVDSVEMLRGTVKHYLDTEQTMFPRLSPNYPQQGADQQETDEPKGRGGERKGKGREVQCPCKALLTPSFTRINTCDTLKGSSTPL